MPTPPLRLAGLLAILLATSASAPAAPPNPVLNTVFPAGGRAGSSLEMTISGAAIGDPASPRITAAGVIFEPLGKSRYKVTIPAETPPGLYDLRVASPAGLSSTRTFQVSRRAERMETEPNDTPDKAETSPLDTVINGRVDGAGDQDCFRFSARRGQRVVIECWAERIDSELHPILQLFDAGGRLLKVNRGYYGIDPLIDFRVPSDGEYIVRLHDLTYTGGSNHIYRLDIDTGPRLAFALPCVIQGGQATRVRLYGWNIDKRAPAEGTALESVEVTIPAAQARATWPLPIRLRPAQAGIAGLAWQIPGGHAPVLLGVTDVEVVAGRSDNLTPQKAQAIPVPCEVSGQLITGDEQDWFAILLRRGEVVYLEALGERIGSPVDLAISVLDADGKTRLFRCRDDVRNLGGQALPTRHADPSGRFVAAADGRYLVVIHNLVSSVHPDPRRTYRLSVRREVPDVAAVVVPTSTSPSGINVQRGGRTVLDVVAFRRRGLAGPIRISARNLPNGIVCPDIFLGPGISRGQVVLSGDPGADPYVGQLSLVASAPGITPRPVRSGTVVRGGRPNGWSRLAHEIPLGIAGESPLRITADGHESRDHHLYGVLTVRHAPGSVLDVAVTVERKDPNHRAAVQLIGVGLPAAIKNQTATIPADKDKGYISFYLPPNLPMGRYTLGVRASTSVPTADGKKTEGITVSSNPVVFDVHEPMFVVGLDPYNPTTIKRGQTLQIKYTVLRKNGFINKVHSELASPGKVTKVPGLRGRGVTFVGQTGSGTIQIIANDDAPLGQLPFLRVYAVGVLEDEALYHGSRFLQLKIVE